MNKNERNPEYLLKKLGSLSLRPESLSRIRESLAAYADFHTVSEDAPRMRIVVDRGVVAGWFDARRWYARAAAGALIVALMTGTTYASEQALPGEVLYPIKVRVAEPVQVALSPTAAAKAETHAALAAKRLQEAEVLAVNKKLDEETQEFLTQEFSKHVDKSLEVAENMKEKGAVVESLEARSSLEARLIAHEDILDEVEDHLEDAGPDAEPARASTRVVQEAVEVRQEVVRETRIALERDLEEEASADEALAVLTKAGASVPKAVAVASESAALETVMRHAADAEEALEDAKESLEGDDPEDTRRALRKAREATRSSEVATVLAENKEVLAAVVKPDASAAAATASSTQPTATTTATTTPKRPASTTTSIIQNIATSTIPSVKTLQPTTQTSQQIQSKLLQGVFR